MATVSIKADTTQAKSSINEVKAGIRGVELTWKRVAGVIWQGVSFSIGQMATAMSASGMAEGAIIASAISAIGAWIAAGYAAAAISASTPGGQPLAMVQAGLSTAAAGIQTNMIVQQQGKREDQNYLAGVMEGWEPW